MEYAPTSSGAAANNDYSEPVRRQKPNDRVLQCRWALEHCKERTKGVPFSTRRRKSCETEEARTKRDNCEPTPSAWLDKVILTPFQMKTKM